MFYPLKVSISSPLNSLEFWLTFLMFCLFKAFPSFLLDFLKFWLTFLMSCLFKAFADILLKFIIFELVIDAFWHFIVFSPYPLKFTTFWLVIDAFWHFQVFSSYHHCISFDALFPCFTYLWKVFNCAFIRFDVIFDVSSFMLIYFVSIKLEWSWIVNGE